MEKKAALALALASEDAEIGPIPMGGGGGRPGPEFDRLSNILKTFNEQFEDPERMGRQMTEYIAPGVAADPAYQNAKRNTPNAAAIELLASVKRLMVLLLKDDTEFYRQFQQNESFRRAVIDAVRQINGD